MKGRASVRLSASVSKFRLRFKNGDREAPPDNPRTPVEVTCQLIFHRLPCGP
jgi:hypothetical protein